MLKQADSEALNSVDDEGVAYKQLDDFLSGLYAVLAAIPGVISKAYFKHEQTPKTLISRG
jgi:hypothetical protein